MGRPPRFTQEELKKLGEELINFMNQEGNYWLKDFCIERNIGVDKLQDYTKLSEDFHLSFDRAKKMQESKLVAMGLSKDYNASFVAFILKNVANWKDKQEIEHSGGVEDIKVIKLVECGNTDKT